MESHLLASTSCIWQFPQESTNGQVTRTRDLGGRKAEKDGMLGEKSRLGVPKTGSFRLRSPVGRHDGAQSTTLGKKFECAMAKNSGDLSQFVTIFPVDGMRNANNPLNYGDRVTFASDGFSLTGGVRIASGDRAGRIRGHRSNCGLQEATKCFVHIAVEK